MFLLLIPIVFIFVGAIYLLKIENQKMNENNKVETKTEKHNPAFHLFLYLVSFLSVGFLVAGIIISFTQAINKFIPDDVFDRDYAYFDNDAMKFGLSALIVTIPLYYGILYLLNKKLEKGEIPADSLIRKTITYLALVAFFGMTLGSLVTLVYNYFDGELTTRFILKVAVFLFVSLFFFGFYFWEVRRSVFVKSAFLKFFSISIALAVFSLILGFFVIDSPKVTRIKKMDNELIRKMENAGRSVNNKYKGVDSVGNTSRVGQNRDEVIAEMAKNGSSPEEIAVFIEKFYGEEMKNKLPSATSMAGIIDDRITYEPMEKSKYKLCGTFKGASDTGGERWNSNREKWAHPQGYHCFTFDAELDGYDVYPIQIKSVE